MRRACVAGSGALRQAFGPNKQAGRGAGGLWPNAFPAALASSTHHPAAPCTAQAHRCLHPPHPPPPPSPVPATALCCSDRNYTELEAAFLMRGLNPTRVPSRLARAAFTGRALPDAVGTAMPVCSPVCLSVLLLARPNWPPLNEAVCFMLSRSAPRILGLELMPSRPSRPPAPLQWDWRSTPGNSSRLVLGPQRQGECGSCYGEAPGGVAPKPGPLAPESPSLLPASSRIKLCQRAAVCFPALAELLMSSVTP